MNQLQNDPTFPPWDRQPLSVANGIPRFVASNSYSDNFGFQWKHFPKTQLDSHTGVSSSYDRLKRIFGDALFPQLVNRQVLEAGCGAGRFTEVLLRTGANITSIDLSSAVEASMENFPVSSQRRIAQASILDIPIAPAQFDFVVCLGVIQHTPDPQETIGRLYEQVKPGGWLILDHYTQDKGYWSSLKPLYRAILKRLPPRIRWAVVQRLVDIFFPLHAKFRNNYPVWFLLCRISPLITYFHDSPELSLEWQREFALLDSHDSLTDWFKHRRSLGQIRTMLAALGAENIELWRGGIGVEGRCQRPRDL